MEIKLPLTGEEYDCLSRHVPENSPASRALTTAAVLSHSGAYGIYHSYEITCDETEAQALRRVAQHHCHSVVTKIDEVIKKAKPNRTTT
jgi:hypothetical protein